jgi:hypothetical protein
MGFQKRKNVFFGTAMGRVVPNHQRIQDAFLGQSAREFAVMRGNADRSHFAFLAESAELFLDFIGELLRLQHPEEKKDINVVCSELMQPLFESSAQIWVPPDEIIGPGGHDEILSLALKDIPQNADQLAINAEAKEEIHPLV